MIIFAYPYMFLLLVLPLFVRYLLPTLKGMHGDALRVPFLKEISAINLKSGKLWHTPDHGVSRISINKIIIWATYILLVTAVARPQMLGEPVRLKNEGRDILLVMDISTSMLEQDFQYQGHRLSRLQAVKAAASDFIEKRHDDHIGLVLFGSRAYLQAPLTYDKQAVKNILLSMDAGMAGNSTAIGDALGLALKSLKDAENKDNKVIILLTDGENNDGSLSLPQAINLAKNEKVKIYTIGVGGQADFVQSILSYKIALPSGLDEQGLQQLAEEAGGQYFRADDTNALLKVYQEIDRLEPQSQEENYIQETKEYYYWPLIAAFLLSCVLLIMKRRNG